MKNNKIAIHLRRISILGLVFIYLPFNITAQSLGGINGRGIPCIWKSILGYPCPGCGLTRAFAASAGGDFLASIRLNPFALISLMTLLLAATKPALLLDGYSRISVKFYKRSKFQQIVIVVVSVLIIYVLNFARVETGFYPG